MNAYPLCGKMLVNEGIIHVFVDDHRDVADIALIAAAGMRDLEELHLSLLVGDARTHYLPRHINRHYADSLPDALDRSPAARGAICVKCFHFITDSCGISWIGGATDDANPKFGRGDWREGAFSDRVQPNQFHTKVNPA